VMASDELLKKDKVFFKGSSLGSDQGRDAFHASNDIHGFSQDKLGSWLIVWNPGEAFLGVASEKSHLHVILGVGREMASQPHSHLVESLVQVGHLFQAKGIKDSVDGP